MQNLAYNNVYRHLFQIILAIFLLGFIRISFATNSTITAIRIWPTLNYTRMTLESNSALEYRIFTLNNPERLVLDIKNIKLNSVIKRIGDKIRQEDLRIRKVRVSQFNHQTVRLVIDLKQKVTPHLKEIPPIYKFNHRLVLDLYPYQEGHPLLQSDSILSLLNDLNDHKKKLNDIKQRKIIPTTPSRVHITQNMKKKYDRQIIIMLDPGHGGEDPGAIGKYKTQEKDIVLQIAHRLHSLIKSEPNMQVYMTRDEDVFIPLKLRVAKAIKQKADLFISIHADAFTRRTAQGASVFALSVKGATSMTAEYLAQIQNFSDEITVFNKSGDFYLDHMIFDLVQTATINDSLKLGQHVLNHVGKITKLHKKSVEQASFAVLKVPDVPSILVETAFISNVQEEQRLRNIGYQQKIAEAIFAGIKSYCTADIILARR